YFTVNLYQRNNNQLSIPAAEAKEAAAAAKPRALAGPEMQRLVALALLMLAAPAEVADIALNIMDDPKASPSLCRDALHISLLAVSRAESQRRAVAALTHRDAPVRQHALVALAGGPEGY